MEKMLIDKVSTNVDENGTAHIMGYLDGEVFEIGTILNAMQYNGHDLHERVMYKLALEGIGIKPTPVPTPVQKRKYTKHVTLGLASEYGKVTLKVVQNEPKIITFYVLYLKGTDKFVYKLTDKGILVTSGTKTKPLAFTSADIKLIRNIEDFDVVKVSKETKWVKNKIAPRD